MGSNLKKIVVLYHNNCRDGFGAAWAAWKKFGKRASYLGVAYHLPAPNGLVDRELYLLDFCYRESAMQRLLRRNRRVVVLDHHLSRQAVIQALPEHRFRLTSSGAVLAWEYFHPKKRVPWLLRYVEDMDLWRFALPATREILLAVGLREKTFTNWNRIAADLERSSGRTRYRATGQILSAFQNNLIERLVSSATPARLAGHRALAVNSSLFRSEVGNRLAQQGAAVGIVWYEDGKTRFISLRSSGRVDVSRLAEKFGGGGHQRSAGFNMSVHKPLPWTVARGTKPGSRWYT